MLFVSINSLLMLKMTKCIYLLLFSIVKFNVPENDFAPIKEVTNEDEEECNV